MILISNMKSERVNVEEVSAAVEMKDARDANIKYSRLLSECLPGNASKITLAFKYFCQLIILASR